MMKMPMRLQRNQVASLPLTMELTASGGSFDRSLYSLLGYLNYEAILIGGAGGRSGAAWGDAAHDYVMRSSGGGGGGSIRLKGKLADLPAKTSVTVGSGGASGADSGIRNKAGNGEDGGDTTFNGHIAYGGKGATGGNWQRNDTTGIISTQIKGEGGDGGGNSKNLGTRGVGGKQTNANTNGDDNSGTNPSDGTYLVSSPVPDVIGGGYGGGGGGGEVHIPTGVVGALRDGADGNKTVATAPGQASGGFLGGGGGGANAGVVIGGTAYYGTLGTTASAKGVVAIKIS